MSFCNGSWDDINNCPDEIESDPDVSGIGVVIAFGVAATISVPLTVGALVLGSPEHLKHKYVRRSIFGGYKRFTASTAASGGPPPKNTQQATTQAEDMKIVPKRFDLSAYIQQVALIWSDQMLISGIALLCVAFARAKSLSLYHFSILTDLAWLASNSQRAPVILLLPTLRRSKLQPWLRIVGMFVSFCLLLLVAVLGANVNWNDDTINAGLAAFCDTVHTSLKVNGLAG